MKSYLFAFDFDETIANTFETSPDGLGVLEAYEKSIRDIFGEVGVNKYEQVGRLQNRAPAELIENLLDVGSPEMRAQMIQHAHQFYVAEMEELQRLVFGEKGVNIDYWNTDKVEEIITEMLVRQKLSYLMSQIGLPITGTTDIWPRPTEGFFHFWNLLNRKKKEGFLFFTAIISSGHDAFIKKTFSTWGLSPPDYLVTDDDFRGRLYPKELDRRVKPGQFPMALAHRAWLKEQGITGNKFNIQNVLDSREHMIYFGDDSKKDGDLALGANIIFGYFLKNSSAGQPKHNNLNKKRIIFTNWKTIEDYLVHDTPFREGKTLEEIVFSS